jgi:hypothetical protein
MGWRIIIVPANKQQTVKDEVSVYFDILNLAMAVEQAHHGFI